MYTETGVGPFGKGMLQRVKCLLHLGLLERRCGEGWKKEDVSNYAKKHSFASRTHSLGQIPSFHFDGID